MVTDIAALHYKYGANIKQMLEIQHNTFSGTYWKIYESIWDAGEDTFLG